MHNAHRRPAASTGSGRPPRLRLAAIAALAAILALLSACGSSAGTKPAATPAPATPAPTASSSPVDGTEIDQLPSVPSPTVTPSPPDLSTPAGQAAFLRQVFTDIQAVWSKDFAASGLTYAPARLVLFQSQVATACGTESAEVGPFYCPGDRAVYLDLQFFQSLAKQFGVSGDFAEAYVVAHEVGHHIQNLLGITGRVSAAGQGSNALSVKVELQADCFAGVWAHSTYERKLLEPGDIEEALKAAQVVGDDYLARASNTAVDPDSWTHGSSAQRQQWFTTGYHDGRPEACDTFAG
jgi:predicted metalloprotease